MRSENAIRFKLRSKEMRLAENEEKWKVNQPLGELSRMVEERSNLKAEIELLKWILETEQKSS